MLLLHLPHPPSGSNFFTKTPRPSLRPDPPPQSNRRDIFGLQDLPSFSTSVQLYSFTRRFDGGRGFTAASAASHLRRLKARGPKRCPRLASDSRSPAAVAARAVTDSEAIPRPLVGPVPHGPARAAGQSRRPGAGRPPLPCCAAVTASAAAASGLVMSRGRQWWSTSTDGSHTLS